MSAPICTKEEFEQLQSQYIALKQERFRLIDKDQTLTRELDQAQKHVTQLDRDLRKATEALAKSKSAQKVQQLQQEKDDLQRMLLVTKEEFGEKEGALRANLSLIFDQNKEYLTRVEVLEAKLRAAGGAPDAAAPATAAGAAAAAPAGADVSALSQECEDLKKALAEGQAEREAQERAHQERVGALEAQMEQLRRDAEAADARAREAQAAATAHASGLEKQVAELEAKLAEGRDVAAQRRQTSTQAQIGSLTAELEQARQAASTAGKLRQVAETQSFGKRETGCIVIYIEEDVCDIILSKRSRTRSAAFSECPPMCHG
ncbi:hypothetical protein PAPYR_10168 [Paratrimastix pyriformis]|uniref:Uncharacterized protein n=1 Tax=Paratrimastix pyriformis TaxID=342808 RepID=A0ABQ8U6M2_9EUKA|nr:hypothetical protein PAPYR_10168 [Paratrimastix pyriformis]